MKEIRNDRRQHIIASAICVLAENGIVEFTFNKVAHHAGISAALIVHYFASKEALLEADVSGCVAMRFVDNHGKVTESYPANPNGSPRGITGLTSRDGRVTIMMPHPERVFRAVQNSWRSEDWNEDAPWMRMFRNARVWVN